MSEKELIDLCAEPANRKILYWTSEIYGFGKIIRQYGVYPASFPLNIYLSHGVTLFEHPAKHELENNAPVILYFPPRLVNAYKKISSKPCYCVVSPNVFYRKSSSIQRDADAKGTLAFLSHTTPMIENKMNLVEYIEQLKALPTKFHPISVCLHYHDVNKGIYKTFFDYEIEVLTVGHPYHTSFIERFYNIVRRFRYTTSNEIGTYAFYCTEMGIPFFLYGIEATWFNHGDTNIEFGTYNAYKLTNQFSQAKTFFEIPTDEVTPEQRAFVEEELGVHHSISRRKMAFILYQSYLILLFKKFKIKLSALLKKLGMQSGKSFTT